MTVELTPLRLFEIVLEEALRDGKVEDAEFEQVEAVKELLGITAEQHMEIFKKVKEKVDSAKKSDRRADRLMIYQKCMIVAAHDGRITEEETERLKAMQNFLSISPEEHASCIASVKEYMKKRKQANQ